MQFRGYLGHVWAYKVKYVIIFCILHTSCYSRFTFNETDMAKANRCAVRVWEKVRLKRRRMNCRTYEILERIHKNFDQIRSRTHSVLLQLTGQPELFLRKHENARIFRTAKSYIHWNWITEKNLITRLFLLILNVGHFWSCQTWCYRLR